MIWDKEEFDVKEEEDAIPTPVSESDITVIPTREMWKIPSICCWEESVDESLLPSLEKNNRRYNIDLTSAMLLSNGGIVDVLAKSGLGQYCQFYPFYGVNAVISQNETPTLVKLPCSRQEVFRSTAVSLKDKRFLTQFIQFVGDSCLSTEEERRSINDVELKQGRSLTRPQNKKTLAVDVAKYEKALFSEFLEKEFHITGVLKEMIVYAERVGCDLVIPFVCPGRRTLF